MLILICGCWLFVWLCVFLWSVGLFGFAASGCCFDSRCFGLTFFVRLLGCFVSLFVWSVGLLFMLFNDYPFCLMVDCIYMSRRLLHKFAGAMGSFTWGNGPPCTVCTRPACYVSDADGPLCAVCITMYDNIDLAWRFSQNFLQHPVLGQISYSYLFMQCLHGDGVDELCHPDCGSCLREWFLAGWICFGP